ncbi:Acetyltransferase, GNAT family [Magnetococcus marinus MC-1]|uniref:Acetyltransferase, GNAT family n=1 Tax=Magnetococcus marinus (strain ATCC BAA-1437 / JCM 17883 / MC-1) TaxID=156889 RepID=A0L6Y6_MAGMM|nr:GNAT family N-acetyltransferase [Magnetococcus marinus]ABK43729.1 Acetyltransferase, GNAT family [Magnetococcus marinus MC-1]
MSLVIRLATPEDLPAMVALLQVLFAIEADFQAEPARQRQGLALLLESPGASLWVAEQQGQVVGMCSLQSLYSTAEGGLVGLVEDVVVASGHQGKGIGARLLMALEQEAQARAMVRLQLLADRNNVAALGFYQRMGWQGTQLLALRKGLPSGQIDS